MSGLGSPEERTVDAAGRRVGLVATRWHPDITDALVAGALRACSDCGVADDDVEVVRVPGAFELPVVAAALAHSRRVDAVVCLGVVVRGGTPHFDYVCKAVTEGCTRVALDSGIPVGFGVLTVDTVEQAMERAGGAGGDKGREAVLAALETAAVLDGVRGHTSAGFTAGPRR